MQFVAVDQPLAVCSREKFLQRLAGFKADRTSNIVTRKDNDRRGLFGFGQSEELGMSDDALASLDDRDFSQRIRHSDRDDVVAITKLKQR